MKSNGIILVLLIFLILSTPSAAFAYPVEELPDDNIVQNPWFRSAGDPNESALDGWIDAGGQDKYWSSSQKESNPTPDQIVSGDCGREELYCGTAARLDPGKGQSGGVATPGVDAYLYQVVQADRSDRKLTFFTHWVSHKVDVAEVSIYAGNTAEGPWELVWIPFFHSQDILIKVPRGESTELLWEKVGFVDTVIEEGSSYYKVEIRARLPEGNDTGFKITGVYFSTSETDEPASPFTTPTLALLAEANETVEAGTLPTRQPRETPVNEISLIPTQTATETPSATPTPLVVSTSVPTSQVDLEEVRNTSNWRGFSTGLITGGLVVLIVFGGVILIRNIKKKL